MYETEEELDRYFGNNKKRVFTVKVTVTDDNDYKREFTDQFTAVAARNIYTIAQQMPSLSVISKMLVDRQDWYEVSVNAELSEYRELLERTREQIQDKIEKIANDVRTTGIANKLDEQTICQTLQGVWNDSNVYNKRYILTQAYTGTCVEKKLTETLESYHQKLDSTCRKTAADIVKRIKDYS